ncbi:MAG TPA: hypothetical protein VMN39_01775 [Longimicrobiaceae bacterium]|nr:hypothetical protein [Longimicrobiaceae bacterium]
MAESRRGDRPFQGGAQPVTERPPEAPVPGWSIAQTIVVVVAVLAVVAALAWVLVPLAG